MGGLGGALGGLGGIFGRLGGVLGAPEAILGRFGDVLGRFGGFWPMGYAGDGWVRRMRGGHSKAYIRPK